MGQQDLMARAAWLYHVEGLTQAEIGKRMNLTRRRVNELLSSALEQGIVRISFGSPLIENAELESQLRDRFGLDDAVVVPTPADPCLLHSVIGRGAAAYLDRLIQMRKPASIGVGWGATLRQTMQHMTPASEPQIDVRSMMGGLTHGSEINTFEIVRGFAEVLKAQCHYFVAPIYAETAQSRDALIAQSVFRKTFRQICEVDISYLSAGDVSQQSLQVRYGLPEGVAVNDLSALGAVGDLLGRYVDIQGSPVDHPLNRQVLSPEFEDYRRIPCRIVASGGPHKHDILLALARAKLPTIMITDAESARAMLR
ncbi:sugar-binding transcriptional regulator [Sinorhizobium medicae]|uniref:Transcriptional regulator, DeoR family n=2 Tax=Sinorhizobium medicae TaxID=110321 RepID=A6UDF8_SINMW|nr:sugar-binding transcriptional regulator [Sinorhizobium medicae]ABR61688.1 transcriptional regulator, DeoR family [Sinorhizobium medicae WSM419]MBO1941428.1 sugar-binding transcriptional regulator [Sinorhizobium medicae]MDX0405414.1 sugar-binding transcriptional regulator [Sinorhizobium medicae]MDX0410603.1 sugar-binding transcriptional regulator [Sinorhizobium medicae]MDX0417028.1 sugar-binding transcriptional regulator [Sinorhizobium medicae]